MAQIKFSITKPALRSQHRRGVTLVEVVVASGLLVAGIVPMLRAITIAHGTLRQVEERSQSLCLAQETLARCRVRAYQNYDQDLGQRPTATNNGYLIHITDDRDPHLRHLTITVGYDRDQNKRLTHAEFPVVLATQVARLD